MGATRRERGVRKKNLSEICEEGREERGVEDVSADMVVDEPGFGKKLSVIGVLEKVNAIMIVIAGSVNGRRRGL